MALRRKRDVLTDEAAYTLIEFANGEDGKPAVDIDVELRTLTPKDLATPRCAALYHRLVAERVIEERDSGRLVRTVRVFLTDNPIYLLGNPNEVATAIWNDQLHDAVLDLCTAVRARHAVTQAVAA